MRRPLALVQTALLALPEESFGLDKGHAELFKVMGGKVRSSDSGDVAWFFVAIILIVIVAMAISRLYQQYESRRLAAAAAPGEGKKTKNFGQQAAALGFKEIELHNLLTIARTVSAKHPDGLLGTNSGRKSLIAALSKRAKKRQHELSMLQSMVGKLERACAGALQDREAVRVTTDLSVWLVMKTQEEEGVDELALLLEVEPSAAMLVDLSEGGAALKVVVDLSQGDRVEFWSAGSMVWIPPLLATVVRIEKKADGHLVHVHFVDPPVADIRRAIRDIALYEQELSGDLDPTAA